jgi:hypothetical protein
MAAATGSAVGPAGLNGDGSRPVSRVLSGTVIHLGRTSPYASSDLPGARAGRAPQPKGCMPPYLVLLRVGFTLPRCCRQRGALLPHHFTLTSRRGGIGGIFSVALSVDSRPPGVTWHPALRSPDFPPSPRTASATVRPTPSREVYRGGAPALPGRGCGLGESVRTAQTIRPASTSFIVAVSIAVRPDPSPGPDPIGRVHSSCRRSGAPPGPPPGPAARSRRGCAGPAHARPIADRPIEFPSTRTTSSPSRCSASPSRRCANSEAVPSEKCLEALGQLAREDQAPCLAQRLRRDHAGSRPPADRFRRRSACPAPRPGLPSQSKPMRSGTWGKSDEQKAVARQTRRRKGADGGIGPGTGTTVRPRSRAAATRLNPGIADQRRTRIGDERDAASLSSISARSRGATLASL